MATIVSARRPRAGSVAGHASFSPGAPAIGFVPKTYVLPGASSMPDGSDVFKRLTFDDMPTSNALTYTVGPPAGASLATSMNTRSPGCNTSPANSRVESPSSDPVHQRNDTGVVNA